MVNSAAIANSQKNLQIAEARQNLIEAIELNKVATQIATMVGEKVKAASELAGRSLRSLCRQLGMSESDIKKYVNIYEGSQDLEEKHALRLGTDVLAKLGNPDNAEAKEEIAKNQNINTQEAKKIIKDYREKKQLLEELQHQQNLEVINIEPNLPELTPIYNESANTSDELSREYKLECIISETVAKEIEKQHEETKMPVRVIIEKAVLGFYSNFVEYVENNNSDVSEKEQISEEEVINIEKIENVNDSEKVINFVKVNSIKEKIEVQKAIIKNNEKFINEYANSTNPTQVMIYNRCLEENNNAIVELEKLSNELNNLLSTD